MIVNRKKANICVIGGNFFYPGMNKIEESDNEKFKNDKLFNEQIECGNMVIVEVKKEIKESVVESIKTKLKNKDEEFTSDISEMGIKDAISVVNETLFVADLKKMKDSEVRKGVLKAIDKQIETIEAQPEKKDDKNGEG